MITLEQLKTSIEEKIRTNGNGEITGQVLQDVLKEIGDFAEGKGIKAGTGLGKSDDYLIVRLRSDGGIHLGTGLNAGEIELNLGTIPNGLKLEEGVLKLNLGTKYGLMLNAGTDSGQIGLNLGSKGGLMFNDSGMLMVRLGSGLGFDNNGAIVLTQ